MPGTDRDRALSLGVIMCLQRKRDWFFTIPVSELLIAGLPTLGIRTELAKLRRWSVWCRLEWQTLDRYCEALENQIARSDVAPLRDAIRPPPFQRGRATLITYATLFGSLTLVLWLGWGSALPASLWVLWALFIPMFIALAIRERRVGNMKRHIRALEDFVGRANHMLVQYDLPPLAFDAGYVQFGKRNRQPSFDRHTSFLGALRRYIVEENFALRQQLAQRLAELSWSPVPTDADGAVRIS
jgi:hypothetical protein